MAYVSLAFLQYLIEPGILLYKLNEVDQSENIQGSWYCV